MIEATHAQEHWLRMAAKRAIAIAVEDSDTKPISAPELVLLAMDLIPSSNCIRAKTDPRRHADQLELAIAFLLRAAVALRREEERLLSTQQLRERESTMTHQTPEPDDLWNKASTPTRVRALMVLAGWSLEDLAREAGLTKQAWSKIFKRENWLGTQIVRAARAFKVAPGYLIRPPEETEPDPDLWAGEDL